MPSYIFRRCPGLNAVVYSPRLKLWGVYFLPSSANGATNLAASETHAVKGFSRQPAL